MTTTKDSAPMTVTHVMSEKDAQRVLPWDHEGPHTGAEQRNYGRAIPPSVKWIVVAEPLVCPTCRGLKVLYDSEGGAWRGGATVRTSHRWVPRHAPYDCPDCNGTGRPDVQIVSDPECPSIFHGRNWARNRYCGTCGAGTYDEDPVTVHGVVAIGAAVPIHREIDPSFDWVQSIGIGVDGAVTHYPSTTGRDADTPNITDQFGGQAVTPGMWAHPTFNRPAQL